jgi:hypothetical protein
MLSARAFRWGAIAEYWAAQGNQVDVICAWKTGLSPREQRDGVEIYRVNVHWVESLRGRLKRQRRSGTAPATGDEASQGRGLSMARSAAVSVLRWLYQNVYAQLYWPDDAYLFLFPAVRRVKALAATSSYDALITVSPHFTPHLVGLRVHAALSSSQWLVDIGDPFSFLELSSANNRRLYSWLNVRTEHHIFRQAHAISVTTEPTRQLYTMRFPDTAPKIHVIPPLLSLDVTQASHQPFFTPGDAVRLVYLGRLYADLRSPEYLLKLFSRLLDTLPGERVELHFLGDLEDAAELFQPYEALLGRRIFLHGPVSRDCAARAMREAAVLVNIGNKTAYQLPSKVVEYVSTGKPILNLTQIDDDAAAAFFSGYPAVLNLRQRESELPQAVETVTQFITSPTPHPDSQRLREWLAPFQIDTITAAYDRLLFESSSGKINS